MQFEEQKVRLKRTCDLCATLLEHDAECNCAAARKGETESQKTPQEAVEEELLPQLGERYDVLSLIGSGGMASVYKIYDKILGKTFAAKIMRRDLALEPLSLRRFADEAEAASAMTHGNIAAVYGHGVTSENVPYLFMDYLEGETLSDLLAREGKLDPQAAHNIFQQICEALIHAHMKGIVHRDIKPSNVFITNNAEGVQVVKLVDFGIAKLEYREEDSTRLTQTGALIGSPLYMSPEQCRGEDQDARSDIYALGCVMYHALAGKPPFSGANSVKIVLQHVKGTPEPFAQSGDESGIANALEECVMRCLEKDPGKRFQSAEQLLAQLQSLTYKGPNKISMVEAKPAPWRRAFAAVIDGAVLMLIGHAIGTVFLYPALQADLLAQSSPLQLWCLSHYTEACAPTLSWSMPIFTLATLLFPAIFFYLPMLVWSIPQVTCLGGCILMPVIPVIYILYCALTESSVLQATIGKWIFGLRVIDASGKRISFWHALIRLLEKFIAPVVFFAELSVTPLSNQYKLHIRNVMATYWEKIKYLPSDGLAGAYVVRRESKSLYVKADRYLSGSRLQLTKLKQMQWRWLHAWPTVILAIACVLLSLYVLWPSEFYFLSSFLIPFLLLLAGIPYAVLHRYIQKAEKKNIDDKNRLELRKGEIVD